MTIKRKYLFAISFLVVIGIAVLQIPLNIDYFKIRRIYVRSNVLIPTASITEKSRYILNRNIFSFGKHRLIKTLLKIPQFDNVDILRKLPDSVDIIITEKKPWLNIVFPNRNLIIDTKGTILNTLGTNPIDTSLIPAVHGLPATTFVGNTMEQGTLRMLRTDLSSIISLFKPEQLQINIEDPSNVQILAENKLLVNTGDLANIHGKRTLLKTLLAHIRDQWDQVDYIDIKSTRCPVIKFKTTQGTRKIAE